MHLQTHRISTPDASQALTLTSLHFGHRGVGKKAYIQAALHADEAPGMLVAQFLRQQLQALEAAGRINGEVILVPAANPIGLAQAIHGQPFGRFDLAGGVNFNRAFPHLAGELIPALAGKLGRDADANIRTVRDTTLALLRARKPRTDDEALKLALLTMAIDADIVLDLHCDNEALLHVYAGAALADAAMPLAQLLGAHALLVARAAGGEPFDEACSRLWWELQDHFPLVPLGPACFAATVELRGESEVDYSLARRDAEALLRFLALQGMLAGDGTALPPAMCAATPLEGVEPLYAPHAGVLVYSRALGERLQPGDAIADIIDPVSGATSAVRCTVAGVFFARSAHRHVLRGMNIGKVAGQAAYRSGQLLSQ
ncbi:deacylase [Duganella sp. FT92W]|uniref:Deacylase n=1 Tax=Pseudoduganella rivuli TaxID=2666085 RepID=A0A7X2IPL4_9BURK|nr:succinylglutamate desuccinylase/aspartoacylase family protein [Pseudoduganella rivuli]MRV73720.1 deacylase [Pseudoduganella rivuli]